VKVERFVHEIFTGSSVPLQRGERAPCQHALLPTRPASQRRHIRAMHIRNTKASSPFMFCVCVCVLCVRACVRVCVCVCAAGTDLVQVGRLHTKRNTSWHDDLCACAGDICGACDPRCTTVPVSHLHARLLGPQRLLKRKPHGRHTILDRARNARAAASKQVCHLVIMAWELSVRGVL
jgi:hypothetical protein